jgi:hypothetical protein
VPQGALAARNNTCAAARVKNLSKKEITSSFKIQNQTTKHHQASGAIGNVGTPSIFRVAVSIFRAPR